MGQKFTIKLISTSYFLIGLFFYQISCASLTVSPTRAVFENTTRSMPIKLTNAGTKKTTYRISFKNMRMTKEGTYEDIDPEKVQGHYAERMVRYAPRQITLEAGETQSIRLLLRKPKGLTDGEYRSHLLFQEVPDTAGLDLNKILGRNNEDGIGVVLTPISGVTIPVIIRQGRLNADANMDNLSFKNSEKDMPSSVDLTLSRSGNRSIHGDLQVVHHPAGPGEAVVVGSMQGISILFPTEERNVSIQLNVPPKHRLEGGRLAVIYNKTTEKGEKVLLANSDLPLP